MNSKWDDIGLGLGLLLGLKFRLGFAIKDKLKYVTSIKVYTHTKLSGFVLGVRIRLSLRLELGQGWSATE